MDSRNWRVICCNCNPPTQPSKPINQPLLVDISYTNHPPPNHPTNGWYIRHLGSINYHSPWCRLVLNRSEAKLLSPYGLQVAEQASWWEALLESTMAVGSENGGQAWLMMSNKLMVDDGWYCLSESWLKMVVNGCRLVDTTRWSLQNSSEDQWLLVMQADEMSSQESMMRWSTWGL